MRNWILLFMIVGLMGAGMYRQKIQTDCSTALIHADTVQFQAMLGLHDGILIDVRTPDEYRTGIIEGAINIDYLAADFKEKIGKLDKTKTYYVYCELGGRSTQAGEYMVKEGFCKVITLDRGIRHWKEAGFPVIIPPVK